MLLPILQEITNLANAIAPLDDNDDIRNSDVSANLQEILNAVQSDEEVKLRNYLETLPLENLQDVQALYMLGVGNEIQDWRLLRTESVDNNRELVVDFLVDMRRNLAQFLPIGLDRLIVQSR
jgi:hypothetical protein